jgi:hypothetical protein
MTVGVSEVPLSLLGWAAIGFPGQTAPGHRVSCQRLQVWRFDTGILSRLDGLLLRGFCLGWTAFRSKRAEFRTFYREKSLGSTAAQAFCPFSGGPIQIHMPA